MIPTPRIVFLWKLASSVLFCFREAKLQTNAFPLAKVTFVSIVPYQYVMTIPAFQAGIDQVHEDYNHTIRMRHVVMYRQSIYSCDVLADYSIDYAAKYFYSRGHEDEMTIFIAPSCTPDFLQMADIAKSWNVPVVSIVGTDPILSDRRRFSNAITVAPINNSVLAAFIQQFLWKFQWTTLFLLCDDSMKVGFYRVNCRIFKSLIKAPRYQLITANFNSEKGTVDYDKYLELIKKSARIVLLMTGAEATRYLMVAAEARKMTDASEFAYLYFQPHSTLPDFPDLHWQRNDSHDPQAKSAFSAVLSITFDNARNVENLPANVRDFILEEYAKTWNISMQCGQKISAIAVAAYESILVFAQLINETLTESRNYSLTSERLRDGAAFIRNALNRTYHLPTGDIHITSGAQRYPAVIVRQFDNVSAVFEPVLMFDGTINQFCTPFLRNFTWQNGPPRSVPLCGFSGENPACFPTNQNHVLGGILITLLIVLVGCIVGLLVFRKDLKEAISDRSYWWMLDGFDLRPKERRCTLR